MDALLPGHAHRSTSDRLLNNYLSSQKHLSTSLLTLLSHSHSSSSSLLAYVTSSPGIPYAVRRSVQHAAFEGPIDVSTHPYEEEEISGGSRWNNYLASLESFRKDLKDVHTLEEELSQVKRDREILITRLIKATKSRPSSRDIAALASASASSPGNGRGFSSSSSTMSFDSEGSGTTAGGGKRSKRQAKLAEAQAEVLGCEEHLRGLEVQLEVERTKVMKHGLMERFRAMEDVARMWLRQARLGINELEGSNGREPDGMLNPNAYELDSNGSLAPSQSASQVGMNPAAGEIVNPSLAKAGAAAPRREQRNGYQGGSVTGSIAEEDENSSGSDEGPVGGAKRFVVHENHPVPGSRSGAGVSSGAGIPVASPSSNGTITNRRSVGTGVGVPSITNMPTPRRANSNDGYNGVAQPRRRTQSEVGVGYKSPTAQAAARRQSLKRTFSGDRHSDGSSIRSARKKGGFFRSIARLFKSQPGGQPGGSKSGGSVRGGRDGGRRGDESPPLAYRSQGGWHTRTDDNIKRVGSLMAGRGGGRNDDSSDSEDDMRGKNLVAVTNMGHDKWAVDKVGLIPAAPASKKVTRSDLGSSKSRSDSTSTITPAGKGKAAGGANVARSQSSATLSKRTRQGSISRGPGRTNGSAMGAPLSIASVLEKGSVVSKSSTITGSKKANGSATAAANTSTPKTLVEVPKAPRSQVTPQMYTVSAPPRVTENILQSPPPLQQSAAPTSTLPASARASGGGSQIGKSPSVNGVANVALGKPVTATNNRSTDNGDDTEDEDIPHRPTTPLPPSKSLSPPARSSLRAPSPMPSYIVSAPGSVVQDTKHEEPVVAASTPIQTIKENTPTRPVAQTQPSYAPTITTDGESVYESAAEDAGSDEERARATKAMDHEDAESEASDDTADPAKYRVVENNRGPPLVPAEVVIPASDPSTPPVQEKSEPKMDMPVAPAPASELGGGLERRKSVRMNIPDSPAIPDSPEKDSPVRANGHVNGESTWTSRIGARRDSSDEEDNRAYAKAKKSLTNSTRRFSGLGQSPVKNPKSKKRNIA